MAKKPSVAELLNTDLYEPVERTFTYYRKREDGNLYFIPDDRTCVWDDHIHFVDNGGVGAFQKYRKKQDKFGKMVRRLIAIFDPTRTELPVGIVKKLLKLSDKKADRLRGVLKAFKLFDGGSHREGALLLADTFGPKDMQEIINGWYDDPAGMLRAEVEKRLRDLAG